MAIQFIVASREPRIHDFVREQLARSNSAELAVELNEMGPNLSVRILQEATPQSAVLLDISGEPEQGLRTLEQLRQSAPDMAVILSAAQCTEDFLLRAMRLGCADFLIQPLKRAEFSDAVARLEQQVQRQQRKGRQLGKMYTFMGVKGGVGTTTAAVNMAALCAKAGKTTVLVDLDMDSGDAAVQLGIRHTYSLADVVDNLDQLDQAMLEGIMARDPLGFSLLCAPNEIERARTIGETQIREIGSFLIENSDTVIVDGSHAMDGLLMACLELSESIFLVSTEEFSSVRNAQHYFTTLARTGYSQEAVKLLVNRHEKKGSLIHVSLEQMQQTLGIAPFWVFPNQYMEAMQSLHEARPVVLKGNTELGKSYRNFARKMGLDAGQAAGAAKK